MKRFLLICLLSVSTVIAVSQAWAVTISIFESSNEGSTITVEADPADLFTIPGNQLSITQEGIGILGAVDAHFVFNNPGFCIGAISCSSFEPINFVEAENHSVVSDTLTVSVEAHAPTLDISTADIHFRSDSLDEISPPCVDLCTTNVFIEPTPFFDHSSLNLSVFVAPESVPEPGTFSLLSVPIIVVVFIMALRRRRMLSHSSLYLVFLRRLGAAVKTA
jgi:hypothetical protein